MRTHYLAVLCILFLAFSTSKVQCQSNGPELPTGNYIVVGAYFPSGKFYLEKFVASLQAKGLSAKSGFETDRNLYYVYLEVYQDFRESIRQMEEVRKNPELGNAWVRVIRNGKGSFNVVSERIKPVEPEKTVATIEQAETKQPVQPKIAKADTVIKVDPILSDPPIDNTKPAPLYIPITLKNVDVFVSINDAQKNKTIQGTIEVIDTERSKLMDKIKGNEYLKLPDPKSKSGQISLICNVFGYRKEQRELSYPTPTSEQAELIGNFYMVNFDMVRYQRGDVNILYNIFFYNDAAIMLPESKYELNQMLEMMQDNPAMKIVLHGHTNGNSHGQIITMGPSKDFFKLTKDVKSSLGSSKELSNQRALVIREWLLFNGIEANRVDVKPWGGKKMLHDKNSVHAKKNIRVEVEVVED
jgi:outer membrane protein OmpA-like peptidoglycan-associated protein